MKYTGLFSLLLLSGMVFTGCSDNNDSPGNPIMDVYGEIQQACFGDSLTFMVKASDQEVPLSTIHAELLFGEEVVSEQVIRTKVSGADYEVKLGVPYFANAQEGNATVRLTLQNIHFTKTEQEYNVKITHADYPYLTLQTEDGSEYRMQKISSHLYGTTGDFPTNVNAKIIAPAVGAYGNEIIFGYENSEIVPGADGMIPFSNSIAGEYTISFNTLTFEGSPFVVLKINGEEMLRTGDTTAELDLQLAKGDILSMDGFPEFNKWWINPDYFIVNADGSLSFNAYDGTYRLIADTKLRYIRVYKLTGNQPAILQNNGSGALWIIGEGIGHPSLSNEVGWTTENAICMAPVGLKTYQVTLVAGKTISADNINFKFFGQMGWGIELTGDDLITQSNIIGVGNIVNGHDNGNLFLQNGPLQEGGTYVITVDLTQGIHDAIMTVEYK